MSAGHPAVPRGAQQCSCCNCDPGDAVLLTNLSCRTLAVVQKSVTPISDGEELRSGQIAGKKGSMKVTDVIVMLMCWYILGLSGGEREGTREMGN